MRGANRAMALGQQRSPLRFGCQRAMPAAGWKPRGGAHISRPVDARWFVLAEPIVKDARRRRCKVAARLRALSDS